MLGSVDDVIARTKVTPKVVSVDDGYASAKNKNALEERNIEVISINGAKGRALTSPDDWASDVFGQARDKRSAVASLMYTLKHGFDFGGGSGDDMGQTVSQTLSTALTESYAQLSSPADVALSTTKAGAKWRQTRSK